MAMGRMVSSSTAAGDEMLQRHAVEELHGDEGLLAILFADFMDGADVGMIQRRGGSGFAPEAFQGLRVLRDIVGQKFQGDEASKAVSSAL